MDPLKMYSLLTSGIFHCYVSLPEGKTSTILQLILLWVCHCFFLGGFNFLDLLMVVPNFGEYSLCLAKLVFLVKLPHTSRWNTWCLTLSAVDRRSKLEVGWSWMIGASRGSMSEILDPPSARFAKKTMASAVETHKVASTKFAFSQTQRFFLFPNCESSGLYSPCKHLMGDSSKLISS